MILRCAWFAKNRFGCQVLFSRPLPVLSNQLNAWVTMLTCQWLMGPCQASMVSLPLAPLADLCHNPRP